jgi:hypothetical protein
VRCQAARLVVLALALALAVVVACGDLSGHPDAGTRDAAWPIDAAVTAVDAPAAADAGTAADARMADASVADATPDARVAADAAGCGFIGKPCVDASGCGGLECMFSVGGSFCTTPRPGCGGFVGATCDDPEAPLCHYLPSADFGPCLSVLERDCICALNPSAILGCP